MKLKKLLPLASIAGVAAVVAPLVTSCGTKTFKYVFDAENPTSAWHPENQISETTETQIYENKAIAFYLDSVKNNKRILADDIVYWLINNKHIIDPEAEQYIESGECNVKVGNVDPKTGKMSFSYNINLEVNTGLFQYKTIKYFIEIENLEYVMFLNPTEVEVNKNYWCLVPYAAYLANTIKDYPLIISYLKSYDDWHITYSLKLLDKIEKETKITINSKSSPETILAAVSDETLMWLPCMEYSYYLFNVELGTK